MRSSDGIGRDHRRRLLFGPSSRHLRLLSVLKLSDLLGMTLAFVVAALLARPETGAASITEFLSMRLKVSNFVLFLGLIVCWHGCFHGFRLYDSERPLLNRARVVRAVKAATLGVLILSVTAILFRIVMVTPHFVAFLWAFAIGAVVAPRLGLKAALAFVSGDALLHRRALVAGTGPRALRLAQQLERDPESAVRVVGFVDEDWPGMEEFRASGRLVVSDLKNLATFLRDHVVDEILLALPMSVLNARRSEFFAACRDHGITMRFPASALIDLDDSHTSDLVVGDDIIISLSHGNIEGWSLLAKRLLDVTLAFVLLSLTAPIFVATGLFIKATSRGPVIFAQERVGLNKRRFRMYKFRTMISEAESKLQELEHLNETCGPTFKLTKDPRVTKIGRFLRATSIDELPQLINVLRGEMSLVGPRPLPVRDVARFEHDRHRRRFSVLPGLTGLWQVSGRSSLCFDRWIELDLQYVDEWSLGLDLKILAKTIPAVLLREGAL